MNRDFAKGLAVGFIFVGVLGCFGEFVITKQEQKIKRYRKMMKILVNVAEGLEEHVDPVIIREVMSKNEFDVMMLLEFDK